MKNWRKIDVKELSKKLGLLFLTIIILFLLFELSIRLIYGRHLSYAVDEELYWVLEPSQRGYQAIGFPKATINKEGFRGKEIESNKTDILLLGDSVTFGHAVEDNETFAFFLEQNLNSDSYEYQVINLGVPGWGLFQEKTQLIRQYEKFEPEMVILTIIKQNIYRQEISPQEKGAYLRHLKFLKLLRYFSSIYFIDWKLNNKLSLAKGVTQNYLVDTNPLDAWPLMEKELDEIYSFLEDKNTTLILAVYPYPDFGEPEIDNKEFYSLMQKFSENKSLLLINDLDKHFDNVSLEELIVKGDGHPSPLAHEIFADIIYDKLIQEKLI